MAKRKATELRHRWNVAVDGHVMFQTAAVVGRPDLSEIVGIYRAINPGSEVTVEQGATYRVPVGESRA